MLKIFFIIDDGLDNRIFKEAILRIHPVQVGSASDAEHAFTPSGLSIANPGVIFIDYARMTPGYKPGRYRGGASISTSVSTNNMR